MALNWVMIATDGRNPVPLPGEKIFYSQEGVRMELDCSGSGYPGTSGGQFVADKGIAHLTNQRVTFIATPPTPGITSLSMPLLHVKQAKFEQPWFGANYFEAVLTPVPNGGLTQPGTLKLTFKDGGGFEFYTIFNEVLNRIQETNETPQHYEALPTYAPPSSSSMPSSSSSQPVPPRPDDPSAIAVTPSEGTAAVPPVLDGELPPAYDG